MFDLAIIGSGYGGSVLAARLAPRARVILLERGRAWEPGQFPTTVSQIARAHVTRNNPLGLWQMRLGEGTGNAFACALGGGSLVNYGITAAPPPMVLRGWAVSHAELAPYYERALAVLRPEQNPLAETLGDAAFLDALEPGARETIRNTIDWRTCTQCGHCVPGCNVGAKRTLVQTYLPLARDAGATVQLGCEALQLSPLASPRGWEIVVRQTAAHAQVERLRARMVAIACGTLGTLDLLHQQRFALSACLGTRLSMNGDALAFLYNTSRALDGQHGAPLTSTARLPYADEQGPRCLSIISGRVPLSVMRFAGAALALAANAMGPTQRGPDSLVQRARRRVADLRGPIEAGGALAQTFMFKLDAQDEAAGVASFDEQGRAAIDWPGYASQPILQYAFERLEHWAKVVGGTVIRDIERWPGMRSFGVHPLGGCPLGHSIDDGVVDALGRVFDPRGGVYSGLRIVDGSIVPGGLGVPPSLTICALAERIADDMIAELKR